MNKPYYPFYKSDEEDIYIFLSEGYQGTIAKAVLITEIIPNSHPQLGESLFNLAFGDLKREDESWEIDDRTRSNNGDMPKIIATVAKIAIDFLINNKGAMISFEGYMDLKSIILGRNQRNVLYQRGIDSNWQEISSMFKVKALSNQNELEDYIRGKPYDKILIMLK